MKHPMLSLFAGLSFLPLGVVSAAPMVELFTSQGCYSCPPADEHLVELIEKNPDLVALEFHVDYWDDLNYGAAGTWKDPFSKAAYTQRQRQYNSYPLEGRKGVYTPQMVVNGTTAQVGSTRSAVRRALDVGVPPLELTAVQQGQKIEVNISGDYEAKALVWLAVFDKEHVTEVTHGENHGKTMRNHHVVKELTPIADWRSGGGTTSVDAPAALANSNTSCAIFVQDKNNGKILGATYCS